MVIAGSSQITQDDDRNEVRLIDRLNYKNLESAWMAGYDSADWRRTISDMVVQLDAQLRRAEEVLSKREQEDVAETADEGEEQADVLALVESLDPILAAMNDLPPAFQRFTTSATSAIAAPAESPQQQRVQLIRAAGELKEPAANMARVAAKFEASVSATDARLRAVFKEMRSIGAPEADELLERLMQPLKNMGQVEEATAGMARAVQALRMAALLNVSLRKAMAPAMDGVTSMENALSTMREWKTL